MKDIDSGITVAKLIQVFGLTEGAEGDNGSLPNSVTVKVTKDPGVRLASELLQQNLADALKRALQPDRQLTLPM
jgi:hypothetical protein